MTFCSILRATEYHIVLRTITFSIFTIFVHSSNTEYIIFWFEDYVFNVFCEVSLKWYTFEWRTPQIIKKNSRQTYSFMNTGALCKWTHHLIEKGVTITCISTKIFYRVVPNIFFPFQFVAASLYLLSGQEYRWDTWRLICFYTFEVLECFVEYFSKYLKKKVYIKKYPVINRNIEYLCMKLLHAQCNIWCKLHTRL